MKNFSAFLEKFKNIKNPKEEKQKIADTITSILGKEIKPEQISITKNILSVSVDNYLKTEMFIKKEQILSALKDLFIKDIR